MCQPKSYFGIETQFIRTILVCRQSAILCIMQFIKIFGASIITHFKIFGFILLQKLLLKSKKIPGRMMHQLVII